MHVLSYKGWCYTYILKGNCLVQFLPLPGNFFYYTAILNYKCLPIIYHYSNLISTQQAIYVRYIRLQLKVANDSSIKILKYTNTLGYHQFYIFEQKFDSFRFKYDHLISFISKKGTREVNNMSIYKICICIQNDIRQN